MNQDTRILVMAKVVLGDPSSHDVVNILKCFHTLIIGQLGLYLLLDFSESFGESKSQCT